VNRLTVLTLTVNLAYHAQTDVQAGLASPSTLGLPPSTKGSETTMTNWITTRREFLASVAAARLAGITPREAFGAAPIVRFGMVTDVHYADIDAAGVRTYRESPRKLEECVSLMNDQRVDFLVELGDFKDQDKVPVEEKTLGYLRRAESLFTRFKGHRYHVLGNHDMDSLSKPQFLSIAANSGIPADRTYYAFDRAGIRFIVLDANFSTDQSPYDHGRFDWGDSNVPAAELAWLGDQVSAARHAVVFVHQQLDGTGAYYVKNAAAVRGVLERSGTVLAVFQGHRHEGGYSKINGIHYYTLKGLIEGAGADDNSYAIVEADEAFNLTVTGYKRALTATLNQG